MDRWSEDAKIRKEYAKHAKEFPEGTWQSPTRFLREVYTILQEGPYSNRENWFVSDFEDPLWIEKLICERKSGIVDEIDYKKRIFVIFEWRAVDNPGLSSKFVALPATNFKRLFKIIKKKHEMPKIM